MFAKATKNFVRETDSGGDLIPVCHLNASDKLQLLSLVTKRRKFWCWQKPKYHFLTVTLSDVLTEDKPIKPGPFQYFPSQVEMTFIAFLVIVESDFAKYMGKFEDFVQGSIEASFVKIRLGAGGKGYVENESSFGNLRKQEIDLQQLMKDVKDRTIDLSSSLLQQVIERKREVLCILREKIITTQRCTIFEHVQTEEKVSGVMGCTAKTVKVSVSENGSMVKDSSVILEIPPATTIAYGVIELFIKHDGQFEFCLLDEQQGGFEKESTEGSTYPHSALFRDASFLYQPDAVDNEMYSGAKNLVPSDASISVLKQDLSQLKTQFQPFVKLPEDKQRALYKTLCELLLHEEMVTALGDVFDDICTGDEPDLEELKPAQQRDLLDFLQLLGCSLQSELLLQKYQPQDVELFSAAHLLISAVSELSDYTLVLLRACCDLQVVPALCCLVSNGDVAVWHVGPAAGTTVSLASRVSHPIKEMSGSSANFSLRQCLAKVSQTGANGACNLLQPDVASADGTVALSSPLVATLTDRRRFDVVKRLLASSNINLEMTESSVKAVTMKEPQFFPLVLYVALCGLHALGGNV